MNFSMALFRSPVIAFMPDITPSERRSQANGIINFMGGVGALLAFFVGSRLYEMNPAYPFLAGAALLAISSFLVVALVDEPEEFKVRSGERVNIREELSKAFRQSFGELRQTLSEAVRDRDKSLLFMLLSIFLWFVGYNAIETFFTSYAKWHLGIGEATGSFLLGFVALGFLVFSLPAGFIGARLGRRRTMTIGLVIIVALLALLVYLPAVLSVERLITAIQAAFLLLGFAWALVNVNSLPTVVDMTTRERLGTHTGLYYFASQTAAITGPPLAGLFIDLLGYSSLFPFSIVFLALSALTLQRVKRGEPRRGY
jgi:MFS family permease